MKFCANCGVQVEEGAVFCPQCGASSQANQTQATQPPQGTATGSQPAYRSVAQISGENTTATALKVIAAIIWIIGAIGALFIMVDEDFVIGLAIAVSVFISGLTFYAFGEIIALLHKIANKGGK